MMVELEVQRATNSVTTPDDKQFRLWVEHAVAQTEHGQTLTIRIVDEEEGRRFNREYRSKDYATNVLSFPIELPEGLPAEIEQSQMGDLLICAPLVEREAIDQGKPEINHWAHLTIHGVLHLLGYDHEQPDDEQVMETMETEILAKLEIPDPYQADFQHANIPL
jgi:probable rRNA maturation factor